MKLTSRFAGLGILILIAFSCKQAPQPKHTFDLTIQITNPVEDYVLARYDERVDTFFLDSGKFVREFNFEKGIYIELQHGSGFYQVFGAPSNDLRITFDASAETPVLVFGGSLAKENEYVSDRRLFDEQQSDLENNLYTAEEEDFILVNDSLRRIREDLFNTRKMIFRSNAVKEFTYLEEALIKTRWINRYMEHELYFPLFSDQAEYVPSPRMLAYKKDINPNDPKLLVLDEYLGMLDNLIEIKKKETNPTQEDVTLDNLQKISIQFAVIDKNITNKDVKQEVKFQSVQKALQSTGIEGAETFLSDFIKTVQDPIKRQLLENDYKKWQALEPGEAAPEISAIDVAGDSISLSQFQGKYVYLDFWASWCKPCREEIPYLEKLTKELEKDNIAVISVSVDEDKDAWSDVIRSKSMTGIQWLANKDQVIGAYNLASIPRYMIIDPQGKIVSANAQRPSGEILKQIREAMKAAV